MRQLYRQHQYRNILKIITFYILQLEDRQQLRKDQLELLKICFIKGLVLMKMFSGHIMFFPILLTYNNKNIHNTTKFTPSDARKKC